MNILITGGSGFVGSNFISYWLDRHENDSIINLDLMTYAANPLTNEILKRKYKDRYNLVIGNICDRELVTNLVKQVELVVHFAAETHVDRSIKNPELFVQTNIIGTHTLLEAARNNGNKRLHYVSTEEVFGSLPITGNEKFTETSNYAPRSPYSSTKASSEIITLSYYSTYGLPVTVTNASNNYGPYCFPDKVIPLYITKALDGLPLTIYGKGTAIRNYLYVEDHCSAIEAVVLKGVIGEKYCISGDAERNTIQIAEQILRELNKSTELMTFISDRPGHDAKHSSDHKKLTEHLGWIPKYNFEDGIRLTVDWYNNNQDWWRKFIK